MDVPLWWVWIGAIIGVCAGLGLFAVLTMAGDRRGDEFGEAQVPPQPSL